ncbi:F-box protein [Legionella sp. CNM-1927-20]|uniref:F-box protein n=1 Tax=Legionella sp. CNM-1927-20 TaxID=3422221 RepID=UPI00403B2C86
MKDKFEFNKLNSNLQIETAQSLSTPDLVNLSMTSPYHLALFKPMIDVRKLLHYVTRGEHEAVAAILKKDMSLIFKRGKVTDCSGRTFDNISSLEYALWALDKHMWTMMLACLPKNEEGKQVFAQLIAQYNKISIEGVTYRLSGKTITEKHFDFENTIIKELQTIKELETQMNSIDVPGAEDWDTIDKHWREGVGGAQKLLPMHVVYEYCSNEPFDPVPKFTSQPKSSKQFYNWATDEDESWFSIDSKLGIDFALYKGGGGARDEGKWHPVVAQSRQWAFGEQHSLIAMTALCEVRTKDFINLKSQLEEQMTLDNRHQVISM